VLDCVSEISILIIVILEISDLQELLRTTYMIIEHFIGSFNYLLIVFSETLILSLEVSVMFIESQVSAVVFIVGNKVNDVVIQNAIKFDKLICWDKKLH